MGILTDVKRRKKILDLIVKHGSKLSAVSYIAGVVWFCALAEPALNARTYFSENALLPGMVEAEYNNHMFASRFYRELQRLPESESDAIPVEWLMNKMSEVGLDTYKQKFTVHIPFSGHGNLSTIMGTNVYGILHAPRIAGTEAVVLSVPYLSGKNMGAIALMMSLADHCRKQSYWSKDMIFVITEEAEIGMQAWLEAYHAVPSSHITSAPLEGHSGSIQAAINLEMNSDKVNHFDLLIEGVNGQLPNLDLINMVFRLCYKESVPAALHTQAYDHLGGGNWYDYIHSLTSMFMMMFYQAAGTPTANHGLYHRYRIEALTLRGVHDRVYGERGFRDTGMVLEGIYRSLNNLLEKFHQSFFFYLLPSTQRYVSIGLYMPPFCALLLGPLVSAVVLWARAGTATPETASKEESAAKIPSEEGKTAEKKGGVDSTSNISSAELKEKVAFSRTPPQVGRVIPVLMIAQFMGALQFYAPDVGHKLSGLLELDELQCTLGSLTVAFVFLLAMPFSLRPLLGQTTDDSDVTSRDHAMLKCAALILLSVILASIAAMNFSLAFFIALFTIPVVLLVVPTKNKFRRVVQAILLLLVSPPAILFLVTLAYNAVIMTTDHNLELSLLISTSLETVYRSLLSALRDRFLLGTWSYSMTCIAVLPNWWLFWYLTLKV